MRDHPGRPGASGSVLASWIIFLSLAGVVLLATTAGGEAMLGVASSLSGVALRRGRSRRRR
jgi:hypothetical protein